MRQTRKIIQIDEAKCDGCGQCADACIEGAIEIVDGKARLVSESYCDGLAACIGECPRDAITMAERDAEVFDAAAAAKHVAQQKAKALFAKARQHACPGARVTTLAPEAPDADTPTAEMPSQLANWPVKLILAPTKAPFYDGATLVVSADCVPFALGDFHRRCLGGKPLVTACPKFGRTDVQTIKLTNILTENDVRAIDVLFMEVPCCFALVQQVREILGHIGKHIPLTTTKVSIRGEVLESVEDPR